MEDGCGSLTEEGAALNIEAVANLTVRVAVRYLQGAHADGNLAILVNEALPNNSCSGQVGFAAFSSRLHGSILAVK